MVTIANIAQRILDESGYETTNIHATANTALTRVEYMIDNAIDHINLVAGTSIADLSGSAGTKSLVANENELVPIKTLSTIFVRAYVDRGEQVAVPGLSITQISTDPQYISFLKLFDQSLNYLRGRSFKRT